MHLFFWYFHDPFHCVFHKDAETSLLYLKKYYFLFAVSQDCIASLTLLFQNTRIFLAVFGDAYTY